MDKFAHLHVHGEYSMLDGLGRMRNYARAAAQLGQPALALTDHGGASGAMEHYFNCLDAGIIPIIGSEMYVAPGLRTDKSRQDWGPGNADRVREGGDNPSIGGNGAYTHITVITKSPVGVRNLFRLQADATASGYYRKPRIDLESLAENASGLIVLSGCAGSAISTRLRLGQWDEADRLMDYYKSTFVDDFFVEVMYHGIPFEKPLNRDLIDLAKRHQVPLIATNDAHYCTPEDSSIHAALLCVQTASTLAKPAFSFSGGGYHIASRAEMELKGLPVEALDNTLAVVERIESYSSVFTHRLRWPRVDIPDGWDEDDALWELSAQGLRDRLREPSQDHWDRLRYEHGIICRMGYPTYFLALGAVIQESKREGVVFGPGRGSAGGSLVAYALGITDLDPIPHRLIFERFLNPERESMPDVDIDVNDAQRDQVIQIARRMYGNDFVAHIGAFGTFGAKAALKDAVRVTGGSVAEGERRAAMLPAAKFGRAPDVSEYTGERDDVYDLATGLFGLPRAEGVHPAGVVFAPEDLRGQVPLRQIRDDKRFPDKNYPWVIGLTDKQVERLGFVKMDFLGLRNLGIIDECLRHLLESQRISVQLPTLPGDIRDPRTFDLLSRGDTLGVFQLDSPGMRELLRKLKPDRFDDVSAVLALYRPGPMGANAHVEYAARKASGVEWRSEWAIHPELEKALRPSVEQSYGLIVWQEQVLEALKVVCGWSYAEAALLFDAMRKKNHAKMAASKPEYMASGKGKGFTDEALEALWATLVPFAYYSFNRAHSAGYGLVAYWTAFLKANYPIEYMAAVLSSVAEDSDRLPEYLAECRRMGIEILPPDINLSGVGFSPGKGAIHYGISAIKGVGEEVYKAVAAKRPYKSLDDFLLRVPVKALNSGALAALVGSGTLDSLCAHREELYVARETLSARAQLHRREARTGQRPLYRVAYGVGPSGLYSVRQRQQWEQQYLSTVLTQDTISLIPRRRVAETELIWLRDLFSRNPGESRVELLFGRATISASPTNWPAVEQAVAELGVFE